METIVSCILVFIWLSIGFGTKAVFKAANHPVWDVPPLPIIWPIFLLIAAYAPNWFDDAA
ncbi:MAG: hypothetical protein PHE88_11765 [Elusimicrobia bacterium]|nr:hypothetical protein [Elusimicrobiota bacterium]